METKEQQDTFFKDGKYITQTIHGGKWRDIKTCKVLENIEHSEIFGDIKYRYVSWGDYFSMQTALLEAEKYITTLRKSLKLPTPLED